MSAPLKVMSASGVPLEGTRLMRVTYMDESGVSPREPIIVQAAVVVHGDDQLIPVEEYLESLVEKHIPEKNRNGFSFHATDIYHGGDKKCMFHNKVEWPDERRWRILDDLVEVPKLFNLPVCVGLVEKQSYAPPDKQRNYTKQQILVAAHASAILQCELSVEIWLRAKTNEITHIIAENNHEVRDAAKEAHVLLRSKELVSHEGFANHPCLPFKRIRDGLQFTSKEESRLLQVADICAWTIRRFFIEADDAERFYRPLHPQIVRVDSSLSLKERPS